MFDLSFAELALIVIVAVIFIGPKELPVVLRAVSKAFRGMRQLAGEFRKAFDDLSREAGVDDIKQEMRMIKGDDGKLYQSFDMPTDKKHDE